MVDIHNLQTAYCYKSDRQLTHTRRMFRILKYPGIVALASALTRWAIGAGLPLRSLIRKTIYPVFCSGVTFKETMETIRRLQRFQVHAVVDYVAEGEQEAQAFEKNELMIRSNIRDLGQSGMQDSMSVKLSAMETEAFFKAFTPSGQTGSVYNHRLKILRNRLDRICSEAQSSQVIVYLDAEDYYMQHLLDQLGEEMMEKYNRERAVVYVTLQMYLKRSPSYLHHLVQQGITRSYFPGIKLVRGAYLEKERTCAEQQDVPSPVFDTKEETDRAYDDAIRYALKHHKNVYTCIATHNEKSTLLATSLIEELRINEHVKKVHFSQLYGMSDHLTFNLAASGFHASKYLPYGEVEKAVPYLLRRAEENSSICGQAKQELERLHRESRRRHRLQEKQAT